MRALILDAGNSRVVLARWRAPAAGGVRLVRVREDPTPRGASPQRDWVRRLVSVLQREGEMPLVVVSVVPELDQHLAAGWPGLLRIDHTLSLPFRNEVADPAGVGADRYCNLAAAVQAGFGDALVVDAGTATTFDLLRDGAFAGGLIAPGMAFAAQQLGRQAARLHPVPFARCRLSVGRTTAEAMQVGSYHVAVGGVAATIGGLLAQYGERPVILTGGLGRFLQRPGWPWRPNWTLSGAAFLAFGPQS